MPSELSSTLSRLVSVTTRLTRIAAQSAGETTSPAMWRTIGVLQTDGALRLGELATASRVSQPTMTNIVARLLELGWVDRSHDSSDARAWVIASTPAGDTALADWRERIGASIEPLFADLTAQQRDILSAAVDIVASRVTPDSITPREKIDQS